MTYTEPLLAVFFLVALAGLVGNRKRMTVAGVAGLFLVCWPPAEWLLARPLEAPYPVRPFSAADTLQAIVVFSAGVDRPDSVRPYALPNIETVERCDYAAWLYRSHPLPVLACGGLGFSAAMRKLLERAGVPAGQIWTEERSRDTHENALYGAEILRAHAVQRVALIVDARSMPRAAACLRKQGIDVTPAPSRFRVWGPLREEWLPGWQGVKGNEETLHEALGLLWYRLRDWI